MFPCNFLWGLTNAGSSINTYVPDQLPCYTHSYPAAIYCTVIPDIYYIINKLALNHPPPDVREYTIHDY